LSPLSEAGAGLCCGWVGEAATDVAAAGSDRARTSEPLREQLWRELFCALP